MIGGKFPDVMPPGGFWCITPSKSCSTPRLDNDQLQVAIRLAHINLKDRKDNFNEFLREGANPRIIQYSYLYFLFAQVIVAILNAESDHRYGPDGRMAMT
jgi:hypothetical protein